MPDILQRLPDVLQRSPDGRSCSTAPCLLSAPVAQASAYVPTPATGLLLFVASTHTLAAMEAGRDTGDVELLQRMVQGDTNVLHTLMLAHVTRLAVFAESITGSRETAAEVVQDVFIRLWERRGSLDIRNSVAGYLWRTTRNLALNARRHDRAQERVQATLMHLAQDAAPVAQNMAPEEMDAEVLARDVHAALDLLPARCREIFLLRWQHGLTAEEIAPMLELSLATVRSQLSRAIRHLGERLGHR